LGRVCPGAWCGEVTVAADLNGDGKAEVIVGTRPGAGVGRVVVMDGASLLGAGTPPVMAGGELHPFGDGYTSGVNVAQGDTDGDNKAEVAVGRVGEDSAVALKLYAPDGSPVSGFARTFTRTGAGHLTLAGFRDSTGRAEWLVAAGGENPLDVLDGMTGDAAAAGAFAALTGNVSVATG
jgi:hypothetical protein